MSAAHPAPGGWEWGASKLQGCVPSQQATLVRWAGAIGGGGGGGVLPAAAGQRWLHVGWADRHVLDADLPPPGQCGADGGLHGPQNVSSTLCPSCSRVAGLQPSCKTLLHEQRVLWQLADPVLAATALCSIRGQGQQLYSNIVSCSAGLAVSCPSLL